MGDAARRTERSIEGFALDVGQGDATLLLLPGGEVVLFDCADDWVVEKVVTNWGIRRISAVIASHLDRDHIGGMLGFLQNFVASGGVIERVFLDVDSRDVSDSTPGGALAKSLIDHVIAGAESGSWKVFAVTAPETALAEGPGWSLRLVAPTQAQRLAQQRSGQTAPNALSGVLRAEIGGHAVLLGGDATLATWAGLPPEQLEARVFRIPHHGGALTDGGVPDGWDADRLYSAIGAEVAILSVGRGYDHPHPDWIRPVIGGGPCRLVCTQVTRRCERTIKSEPAGLRASAIRSTHFVEPPWRHLDARDAPRTHRYEIPCAGTVVFELGEDGTLRALPEVEGAYRRLIDGWSSPLCRPAPG